MQLQKDGCILNIMKEATGERMKIEMQEGEGILTTLDHGGIMETDK